MDFNSNKTFTLKWGQHQHHLMGTMAMFLDKKELVDVTVLCTHQDIHQSFDAHRIVLAASSAFFCKLFTDIHQGPNSLVVLPKEIRAEDFKRLLQIIYYGTVTIPLEDLDRCLEAARTLKIQGLLGESNDYLLQSEEQPDAVVNQRKFCKMNPKYRFLVNQHRPFIAEENSMEFSNLVLSVLI